ncbi:hypothetical protein F5B21DRAFT_63651 [Xylaria acuta]|nr:hypothetical protein F5B21DRAFT_63651 [Xylaria acuta]
MQNHNSNISPDSNPSHPQESLEHSRHLIPWQNGSGRRSNSTKRRFEHELQPSPHHGTVRPPILPGWQVVSDGNATLNPIIPHSHSPPLPGQPNGQVPSNGHGTLNPIPTLCALPPLGPQASADQRVVPRNEMQRKRAATDKILRILLERKLAAHNVQIGPTGARASYTPDDIQRSIELHRSLSREALATPLTAEYLRVEGIEMKTIEVDHPIGDGRKMAIPFFPLLLNKTSRWEPSRSCGVCSRNEEFSPTAEVWGRATQGFGTQWIRPFLVFLLMTELPECHHALDICRTCMGTYIQTQVNSRGRGAVNNIKCPSLKCRHTLTLEEIRGLAPVDTFRTYNDYLTLRTLSEYPDFRWCLRPGCGSGGFHGGRAGAPIEPALNPPVTPCPLVCITCPDCELAMCYHCQVPWHTGLTCLQYQQQHAEESDATGKWLRTNTKHCPGKECGVCMEANGGCYRVTCTECGTDFCWACCGIGSQHNARCKYAVKEKKRQATCEAGENSREVGVTGDDSSRTIAQTTGVLGLGRCTGEAC